MGGIRQSSRTVDALQERDGREPPHLLAADAGAEVAVHELDDRRQRIFQFVWRVKLPRQLLFELGQGQPRGRHGEHRILGHLDDAGHFRAVVAKHIEQRAARYANHLRATRGMVRNPDRAQAIATNTARTIVIYIRLSDFFL